MSPTSRARADCSPRPTRSSRSSRPTTRTRGRRSTSSPVALRRHATTTSSSACTAWASRSTSRWSASVADGGLGRPCRIYAPVGTHETLLAYLVRRLLENGANSSFVHRIADPAVPIDALIEDPVAAVERSAAAEAEAEGGPPVIGRPHPSIPLPRAIYGSARRNSRGIDLSNEDQLAALDDAARADRATRGGRRRSSRGLSMTMAAKRSCCATRPITTMSSARCARRRSPMSSARWRTPLRMRPPGPRPPRRSVRRCSSAPPTGLRPICRFSSASSRAKRERRSRTGSPRCARRSTSCASTRRRRVGISPAKTSRRSVRSSASARGISRSRSSPARSLLRSPPATRCWPSPPSRRRSSPPRWCGACTRRRPARRRCSSCPAVARRSARRWSATRGSQA